MRVYSCVAAAKYGPDPAAQVQNGILPKSWATLEGMAPVKTFAGTPPAEYQPTDDNLFAARFNGINTMVCKFESFPFATAHIAQSLTIVIRCLLWSCHVCRLFV